MRQWLAAGLLVLGLAGCHRHATLEDLAAQGQIDTAAPLQVQLRLGIKAPPEKIWAILINIPSWPSWNPHITQAVAGAVGAGTPFSWTTGGMTINSTIQLFTPDQELAWTGHVLNFNAIHIWSLAPQPDGSTMVTLRESVAGFLLTFFYSEAELQQGDEIWLQALKTAAEAAN